MPTGLIFAVHRFRPMGRLPENRPGPAGTSPPESVPIFQKEFTKSLHLPYDTDQLVRAANGKVHLLIRPREPSAMNKILLTIVICWAFGWAACSVALAIGFDVPPALSSMGPNGLWGVLVAVAAYVAWRVGCHITARSEFSPGDHVVYLKQKFTRCPGPRAEQVHPAAHGEGYSYIVRKPWTVVAVIDDQTLEVVTNSGKHHRVRQDDPKLHHAGPLEELMLRYRWRKEFPTPG